MRKPAAVVVAGMALSVAVLPVTALAGGRFVAPRGPQSHGVGRPPGGGFHDARRFGGPVHHRGHAVRTFQQPFTGKFLPPSLVTWFPSTVLLGTSPAVYAPPPVSSPVVIYSAPIVTYIQPAAPAPVTVTPAPPPLPVVVEHPTGRYELRGDGVTTPHVWVWVPSPPPAPPSSPPDQPPAGSVSPVSRTPIYRWTDEDGTTVWTNRLDAVRAPYRSQARPVVTPGGDAL